jgi:ribonuclease P protein component
LTLPYRGPYRCRRLDRLPTGIHRRLTGPAGLPWAQRSVAVRPRCQFSESHREQAHVPAEQPPPRADARVSVAHAHSGRSRGSFRSPTQGSPSSLRLNAATPMLPAANRMRHRRDFDRAVRTGRRATRSRLTVHLARNGDAATTDQLRVGFIVSRAVGPAVVRNRVRRQLRHVVRDRVKQITATAPGAALVVRATPQAADTNSVELARDFDRALDAVLTTGPSTGSVR